MYESSSESYMLVLENVRARDERVRWSISISLCCFWFHAPWDIPNQPVYVLLDYINVTTFFSLMHIKHMYTDTNKHTYTYICVMKDKWVGCRLLGAVPTQNNKGTNCFLLFFSVYLICYSKLFD